MPYWPEAIVAPVGQQPEPSGGDRATLWLPLLRALTQRIDAWTVWKNADSALYGRGDVDSAAPRSVWPQLESTVYGWAAEQHLGPTVVCRHIPRTLNLLTLQPGSSSLLQLEVKAGATYRGSLQFSAADVLALSILDERGFRRLRDGAQGLLKMLNNGSRRGGAPDWEGLRNKGVVELLRADPEGAAAMAARFGAARGPLLAAVDAVTRGEWDRRAVVAVEAHAMAKALVQPHVVAERIWFRAVRKPGCPVLRTVYRADRDIVGDVDAWLLQARQAHAVVDPR